MNCLKRKANLPVTSRVLPLNPVIDDSGFLKVGGRLANAPISDSHKRPILLPKHHRLTELIIMDEHISRHHAGPQLLLASLSRRYWILSARETIRKYLRRCVVCTRQGGKCLQQFMGDLPATRITPARAFLKCGVDYAGPFTLRAIPPRSKASFKGYLAVFICFATHAIHVEVVTSLSTPAFLDAFRRFIARRGLPSDVYSDQGTNFTGASKEFKEMLRILYSSEHHNQVAGALGNDGITWHFNPPGAPHFGGLWEAGVKSVKYHLYRIMQNTRLTYEEMSTVSSQIEACLNSRPLTPISTDPNDLRALTPGDFLIGCPLIALPDSDVRDLPLNKLDRWQQLQRIQQHFWHRWTTEYMARLQQRPKWLNHRTNLCINDLVLIKDDRYPPQQWKLGRVIILHPGADGLVRAVTLRTAEGELQRPIVKLCLLPVDSPSNPLCQNDPSREC